MRRFPPCGTERSALYLMKQKVWMKPWPDTGNLAKCTAANSAFYRTAPTTEWAVWMELYRVVKRQKTSPEAQPRAVGTQHIEGSCNVLGFVAPLETTNRHHSWPKWFVSDGPQLAFREGYVSIWFNQPGCKENLWTYRRIYWGKDTIHKNWRGTKLWRLNSQPTARSCAQIVS